MRLFRSSPYLSIADQVRHLLKQAAMIRRQIEFREMNWCLLRCVLYSLFFSPK